MRKKVWLKVFLVLLAVYAGICTTNLFWGTPRQGVLQAFEVRGVDF